MNRQLAKELSAYACEKYSCDCEIDRCIEEMVELTKALLKDRRAKQANLDDAYHCENHVLSELGDLIFTLHHIQTSYGFSDKQISDALDKSMQRFKQEESL